MLYYFCIVTLSCLLLAFPARAGQKICESPPDSSRATLELPGRMENTLYVKGEPTGRFLLRFEWICRKGHIYREAGSDIVKIPLGNCFQPGKLHITVRKGCAIFEVHSERGQSRGRR
jgi:hypothetical protein